MSLQVPSRCPGDSRWAEAISRNTPCQARPRRRHPRAYAPPWNCESQWLVLNRYIAQQEWTQPTHSWIARHRSSLETVLENPADSCTASEQADPLSAHSPHANSPLRALLPNRRWGPRMSEEVSPLSNPVEPARPGGLRPRSGSSLDGMGALTSSPANFITAG
jgi:hypothetical protein